MVPSRRAGTPFGVREPLCDLLLKPKGAEGEEAEAHAGQKDYVEPEIAQHGSPENDGALEFDVIGGWESRADCIKDFGHRLSRENEAGEKDGWQDEDHGHL